MTTDARRNGQPQVAVPPGTLPAAIAAGLAAAQGDVDARDGLLDMLRAHTHWRPLVRQAIEEQLRCDGRAGAENIAAALVGDPSPFALPTLSGLQLRDFKAEALRYVADRFLPRARQGSAYGPPGVGKSTLGRHIAGAVLSGGLVFGKFKVEPGNVVWVTKEEPPDDLRRGFAITAAGGGYDLDAIWAGLTVVPLRDDECTLADPATWAALDALVRDRKPVLLVLDAYASLTGVDLNDPQQTGPILTRGSALSSSADVLVLWIGHDNKNAEATDIDALFGARQNAALLDFAYRVLPAPGSRDDVLLRCVKMRGAAKPPEMRLQVVSKPDELHSMLCVDGGVQDQEIRDAARSALKQKPGATMSELRDTLARKLNRRPADVAAVVHQCISDGLIVNTGSERRFALEWVDSLACPDVSQHVPDTPASQHVPHVPPPKGGRHGTWDMHTAEDIEELEAEAERPRSRAAV